MSDKKLKWANILALALGIALLPPIWAVTSPYIGVSTGAVALICAGLYVTNGNKARDALKISVGFLLGDLWAFLAVWVMELLPWNKDAELYVTLFVMGGAAVIIAESLPKFIFLPAWLCGWAVGLTIMGPLPTAAIGTLPLQIGAAMVAGVVYVGIGVNAFQKMFVRLLVKNKVNISESAD